MFTDKGDVMDARTYMREFGRTLSRGFHSASVSPTWLRLRIRERGVLASRLKKARNALFYGCKPDDPVMANGFSEAFLRKPDLLHALLGIDCESFELLEMAFSEDAGEELRRRVVEEAGDLLYFVALALSSVESDLDEAMEVNIAKLRDRYPERFSNARYLPAQSAVV